MKAHRNHGSLDIARFSTWWTSFAIADRRLRNGQNHPAAVIPALRRLRTMSRFFCFAVWLSSLAALWMTRGWVGLFVSGQVLSAGTCLLRGLARKTTTFAESSNRAG
jgi:hypothetical protein